MNDYLDNQMDQPPTPLRSTAVSDTSDSNMNTPDSASSPGPPSTRPNPFDEPEHSARKRRRTSGSASPPQSISDESISAPKTSSTFRTAPNQQRHNSIPATAGVEPDTEIMRSAQTPTISSKDNTTPLSSSKVTINLRKANDSTCKNSGMTSPNPAHDLQSESSNSSFHSQQGATTMVLENELPQERSSVTQSPRLLESGSPKVELIGVSDGEVRCIDDEMTIAMGTLAPGTPYDEPAQLDPMNRFPYTEPGEDLSATLQRLVQYFTSNSPIDSSIIRQVQVWLENFLEFAKAADKFVLLESREKHKSFWLRFPDVVLHLTARSPEFVSLPELRSIIMDLYLSFSSLTAQMIILDLTFLRKLQHFSPDWDSCPAIYSPDYLQQLHGIAGSQPPSMGARDDIPLALEMPQAQITTCLLSFMQAGQGDSMVNLAQLAVSLSTLVPNFPTLIATLSPVAQILGDCLRESVRAISEDEELMAQTQGQLEMAHSAGLAISSCMEMVIERHVTHLNVECATILLKALPEVFKSVLRGSHRQASETVQLHRETYPKLPSARTFEAIAWQWRLDVLQKLIRSSQMQLRVMAISKLCADLVAVWKGGQTGDESTASFLEYLANQLLETHLVDYILGADCHPEIILESSNVLGFLIVTKKYSPKHTDQLWHGLTLCQDSRVAEALARMTTCLINLFDYDCLSVWCEKFQTLPMDGFSPVLRSFWDGIMNDLISRCQSEQRVPSFTPFDLCLRILRETSVCTPASQASDPELQLAAMQKLRELLNYGPCLEGRKSLYLSCIDDISKKTTTTLGSLWCLSIIIPKFLDEFMHFTTQYDIARLIIEELIQAVNAGQNASDFTVLSGRRNTPRRDLVSHVVEYHSAALKDEIGIKLLNILIGPDCPCLEDRKAGWLVLVNLVRRISLKNSFLKDFFSRYLPNLPASCFSGGMLEFLRERVLSQAKDSNSFALEDLDSISHNAIEQLWRIVLEGQDPKLVTQAIYTIAVELHLETPAIVSCSIPRSRELHILLAKRCLDQMKRAASEPINLHRSFSSHDGYNEIVVANPEVKQQILTFRRSLQLLRLFLEKHQASRFSIPDIRPLMQNAPEQMPGDSAALKYQAFDHDRKSDIKHLEISRQSTVATLLYILKTATGFDDYRMYCRGQQLIPTENELHKTLHDLNLHHQFIIVKREENSGSLSGNIKAGSTPLEIEILSHFHDLWEYLSLGENLAEEVYDFLVKLPSAGHLSTLFDSDTTLYTHVFLKRQPFKMLYAIHALGDYMLTSQPSASLLGVETSPDLRSIRSHKRAVQRSFCFVVNAIEDPDMLHELPASLQLRVAGSLVSIFGTLVSESIRSNIPLDANGSTMPHPTRLVEMLSLASTNTSDSSLVLIKSTCAAILRIGILSSEFWNITVSNTSFLQDISDFLLKHPKLLVRQALVELIEDITAMQLQLPAPERSNDIVSEEPHSSATIISLCVLLITKLPNCVQHPSQSAEYFEALVHLVPRAFDMAPSSIDIGSLAEKALELLLRHVSIESIVQPDVTDPVASGLASVLHMCLQTSQTLAEALWESKKVDENTVSKLFWRHLFPRNVEGDSEGMPRVVLNTNTRVKLCDIIFRFAKNDVNALVHVLDTLNGLVPFYVDDPEDPYLYDLPYQFDPSRTIRAPCGYVGLKNLSNTCYLNSLLTQLFMNTHFRGFIMSVVVQDPQNSQQLLFYTQKLFGFMQESYERFVDPFDVVNAIKTYEDTTVDIHSQMDVDEFYNLLFDRWEGQMQNNNDKQRLRSFFGGQLVQQVKSKECEHISERLEPFSAIQCDIKGKSTLQESLQAYVDGELMEGENKYKCSSCDRHVAAVKRACLKDVPNNLIFHLKRFDFNLRTLQRSKINDYFSFPLKLDVAPYNIEHLSSPDSSPKEDLFELVGILVHAGTAESGHYYSYIRERGGVDASIPSWVEFNDDTVEQWNPSLMESSTFGGPDRQSMAQDAEGVLYEKPYSAYMLFYQRASSLRTDGLFPTDFHQGPADVPILLKEHIFKGNTLLLRRHCLFDPSYSIFAKQGFQHAIDVGENSLSQLSTEHAIENLAMELALSVLDQVVSRAKSSPFLTGWCSMVKTQVLRCCDCALAFYNYFNERHPAFRSLMQRSPDTEVRNFIGQALILAAEKIRRDMPRHYHTSGSAKTDRHQSRNKYGDVSRRTPPVVLGILGIFNHLWRYFQIHIRSWDEYFGTMLAFAKLGDDEVIHLLSENYLFRLIQIISADPRLHLSVNYQRMLANLLRRFNSKPASYTAILSLIEHLMTYLEPALSTDVIVDDPQERQTMSKSLSWTSEEIGAIAQYPEGIDSSLFVEKILEIDQSQETSLDILSRLIGTGEEMDVRIWNTLHKKLQGDTSALPMDSSIKAAGRYVECSKDPGRARALIAHLCSQARNLQHSEGILFVDFIQLVLESRQPDEMISRARRHYTVRMIPMWAPCLLTYENDQTQAAAERLINNEIIQPLASNEAGFQDDDSSKEATLECVTRQLGIRCLLHLRDVYVKRDVQLELHTAKTIMRVINNCTPSYSIKDDPADTSQANDRTSFIALRREVMVPLQRLLVEDIDDDDDGSEWDGSCSSSEMMDTNIEVPMQTTITSK